MVCLTYGEQYYWRTFMVMWAQFWLHSLHAYLQLGIYNKQIHVNFSKLNYSIN